MSNCARLLLVISFCALMVPRQAFADLPRVHADERPRFAIDVLGNDQFTCSATEVFYQDAEHILAICGKNAVRFDAKTGKRRDIRTDVGVFLGPTLLLRGGDHFAFGTTWKGEDSVIEIWDTSFKQPRREIQRDGKKLALALSHDGKRMAILETKYDDLSIDLVDVTSGEKLDQVAGPEYISGNSQHNPLAWFVRDGRVLVVSHYLKESALRFSFYPVSDEGTLSDPISTMRLPGFNGSWRFLPTRDDDHVLFVGNNGTVMLQNFVTGKTTASTKLNGVSAFGAAVNRDLSILVVSGNSGLIHLWDVAAKQPLAEIKTGKRYIRSVNFSPDDEMLVAAGTGRLHFWEMKTGREVAGRSNPLFGAPAAVAVSPDLKRVAVADGLGRAQLWDLNTREQIDLEDNPVPAIGGFDPWVGPNFLTYSSDGTKLVGGSNNAHNAVNVWDAASGRRLMKIAGHRWPIRGVAISDDGTKIASTSRDSTIRVCDEDGKLLHTFPGGPISLAFFPDGDRLVVCHTTDKGDGLQVFNIQTGKLEKELHTPNKKQVRMGDPFAQPAPYGLCVTISPDGKQIASVHGDSVVRLWNLDSAEPTREITLGQANVKSHPKKGCIAFSPDGKTLAASAGTESIFLCDVKSGEVKSKLVGHRKHVTSCGFNNTGEILISVSPDYRAIMWNVRAALAAAK